jgi:hypothetical protein
MSKDEIKKRDKKQLELTRVNLSKLQSRLCD